MIIFQLINISPPHVSCLLIYFINLTNCNKHSLPRLHFIKYKVVPHQNRPLGHRVVPSPGYVRGSGGEYSQHHPVDPHHLHARAVPGRVLPLPAIQSPQMEALTLASANQILARPWRTRRRGGRSKNQQIFHFHFLQRQVSVKLNSDQGNFKMNEMQQVRNVKIVKCYYSEERRCDTPAEKTINQMIPLDVFSQVVVRREKAALDDDIVH